MFYDRVTFFLTFKPALQYPVFGHLAIFSHTFPLKGLAGVKRGHHISPRLGLSLGYLFLIVTAGAGPGR